MKTCTKCGEAKEETEFHRNGGRLCSHCKTCVREQKRAYYASPGQRKARRKARRKDQRQQEQVILARIAARPTYCAARRKRLEQREVLAAIQAALR